MDYNNIKIFTIGVYGCVEDVFFGKLINNNIDVFCDIRQRRGVRGRQYAFVNSKYLQHRLSELNIKYLYEKKLAPTKEIRMMQWAEDKAEGKTKKTRYVLGNAFCCGYEHLILDVVDLNELMATLNALNTKNVAFFCLESNPEACHRSLLAKRLAQKYNLEVIHL